MECDVELLLCVWQVSASVQDGSGLQTIRFSDVNNTLDLVPDVVPEGSAIGTRYELWLGPTNSAAQQLYFELDSCSGDYNVIPTLYVCTTACPDASQPASASNANKVTKISTANGGQGWAFVAPNASAVLYAAVTANTNPTAGRALSRAVEIALPMPWRRELLHSRFLTMPVADSQQTTYVLKITSAQNVYKLGAADMRVTVSAAPPAHDGSTIMGFEVNWNAAALYFTNGTLVSWLTTMQYTVFYSPNKFPASIQSATPCGLDQSQAASQVLATGTHWIADNLQPNTTYEVNVVAYCNEACFAASGKAGNGVLIDRVAYRAGVFTTPSSPNAPTPRKSNNVGITVLIVILVVLGVGAGVGFIVYYKRKQSQRVYQYEMFEMADAGTYATPGNVYSALE